MKRTIVAVILMLSAGFASGVDSIVVRPPLVNPDTQENTQAVNDVLKRAAVLAGRRYETYFSVDFGTQAGRYDYTIEIIVNLDGGSAGVFEIGDGNDKHSASYMLEFNDENIGYIASIYAMLWNTVTDEFAARQVLPPDLVDVLPMAVVLSSVPGLVPAQINSMAAFSAAVKSNGNLLLAFGSVITELDPNMRVVGTIGRELMEKGNYSFAGGVYVTPADTMYLKPTMGRQAMRLVDGSDQFQPINLGLDPYGPFTVLHDGTIITFDTTTQKTYRIESSSRSEIDLKTSPSSYIWQLGTGPDGNIWSWDLMERRFKIHTGDADLIDAVMPITSAAEYLSPMSSLVYPDGSFVLFVQGAGGFELRRYGRDGVLLWKMVELGLPQPETLPSTISLAFDDERAMLYLLDTMGRRIFRFFDSEWAATHRIVPEMIEPILEINERLRQTPGNPEILREKAEVYSSTDSVELAIATWKELLAVDPYDFDAQDRLNALQVMVLRTQAQAEAERTFVLLEQFGPASAQLQYMNTLKIYEQILNLTPDDDDARRGMEDLMRAFQERSTAPAQRIKPAKIARIELANLFPSLMLTYRDNPAGFVSVMNTTGGTITDVRSRFFIKKYMDFPAESQPLASLEPGVDAALPLMVLFNDEVLSLQEDLPIQAQVEVRYLADGEERIVAQTPTVTLYRNTALSWDDSGKLASFIMPNEGIVSTFAHRVLSNIPTEYHGLPEKLTRAAKLCDALGTYGIEYIEDPDSPFSRILGKAQIIDTVRFPRTTLHIRSGDCDDSTALLGSLLESSGISTAIMTSPGHVFLAFDTAEPEENYWLFEVEGHVAIRHAGTLWLPLETTTLEQGFLSSWRIASGLVNDHAEEIEFLPVLNERDFYPALPLPQSSFEVVEPQSEEVNLLLESSMAETVGLLYTSGEAELQTGLRRATGRKELKLRNQLGVLHARFGENEKAVSAFEENMRIDPGYTASYLNLANLMVQERRSGDAIDTLRSGLAENPSSTILNLLIARIFHANGDYREALRHFTEVEKRSPDLAERYAYLAEGDDTTRRAGIEWEETPLIWAEGDE